MLVLSRKVGEKVCVGDDIVVTVVAIEGNRIKLGFQCPSGIPVDREEVRLRIDAAKHESRWPAIQHVLPGFVGCG